MKEVFGLAPEIPPEQTVVSADGWLEPDDRIRDTVQSIVDALNNGSDPDAAAATSNRPSRSR